MSEDTNVRVAVRCRPLNSNEATESSCCFIKSTEGTLNLKNNISNEEQNFAFDILFDENSTQDQVWEQVGFPTLEKAFSGYNGTIFAYGQTGSGKTWSMQGGTGENRGIIPRMNFAIFDRIAEDRAKRPGVLFLVMVSYFEIYNEVIYDLLDSSDRKKRQTQKGGGLEIKQHPILGVYVKGLQEIVVDNANKLQSIIDQGSSNRTVASTLMNSDSSRSHSVFIITIHQKDAEDETKNCFAKVNLVDLAGSERAKSTGATGAALKEGSNINKSLSELGNVINALVEQAKGKKNVFIPYRNSKLTRVLQESLGGNSITTMLAALSPALCNFDETLSTLKYANRAKAIKVKATKNDESSQISKLNDEIKMLREKLMSQQSNVVHVEADTSQLEEKHKQQLKDLEEAMKSTWEEKIKISEDHERVRKQLEVEQINAKNQLELQKERNWTLLEERMDLELSLNSLKNLFDKEVLPESSEVSSKLSQLFLHLREINRLERALAEEDTVIDVYRISFEKDALNLFKRVILSNSNYNSPKKSRSNFSNNIDVTSLSTWKHLKDKLDALLKEMEKWSAVDISVSNSFELFAKDLESFSNTCATFLNLNTFTSLLGDVEKSIKLILRQIRSKLNTKVSLEMKKSKLILSLNNFKSDFVRSLSIYSDGLKVIKSDGNDNEVSIESVLNEIEKCMNCLSINNKFEEECICPNDYNIVANNGGTIENVSNYHEVIKFNPCTPGDSYIQINFKESTTILGVKIENADLSDFTTGKKPTNENTMLYDNNKSPKNYIMPCGISFDTFDGDINQTKLVIGDIINWELLLKNNPPEKFLSRPPVRFVFDFIQIVDSIFHIFPENIISVKWDLINESKQKKIDFINDIIKFTSQSLMITAATNASSVVTGSDPPKTNIFLQQIAFLAFLKDKYIPFKSNNFQEKEFCFPTEIGLIVSTTNDMTKDFDPKNCIYYSTNLSKEDHSKNVTLKAPVLGAKFIRMYPIKWHSSFYPDLCSFRIKILSNNKNTNYGILNEKENLNIVSIFEKACKFSISALESINNWDQKNKSKQENEMKQLMNSLAIERKTLEATLSFEKKALADEKQGLSDQLANVLVQFTEIKKMYDSEVLIRKQLEDIRDQLVEEKSEIISNLEALNIENSQLKAKLLILEANLENEKLLKETFQSKIDSHDSILINYKNQLSAIETEKDELNTQLSIVTEERDSARMAEEELYESYKEMSHDFEMLQESYVNLTDKSNDAQDEIADLREKLLSLT